MRKLVVAAVAAALVVSAGYVVAGELKSGPQAGEKIPGPFHPLNVNGEQAGQKACLVCKHGDNPVAMVFARCADCPMTVKLIKKLDAVAKANERAELGTFAVFLTDDEKTGEKLKALADKEGIKTLTLAVDNPAGPSGYKVQKDADVTVVLYNERTVKVNKAFKAGELKDADIDAIAADAAKLVSPK